MSNYKEFQGKGLDEAIQEACDYFDMKRDKLEVEIVSGGSTGIFGLVGAKSAIVKARPRNLAGSASPRTESRNEPQPVREAAVPAKRKEPQPPAKKEEARTPAKQDNAPKREAKPKQNKERKPRNDNRGNRADTHGNRDRDRHQQDDNRGNRQPKGVPFKDLNKEALELTVREVTVTLIEQLVMAPKLEVKVGKDRVNVLIDEPEHSGLIIGREGQTLSSLQYLVNRIVSRRMEASVRVQIDTGDYRERQDDKLRQTAKHLGEKACRSGRTQSTKPMSSYHRRIVHLTLQDDERLFTRSKGDGPMKRVLIVPKKRRGNGRNSNGNEQGEVNGNR